LVRRLVSRGNDVDVVTTTIVDLHRRPALRSSVGVVDRATVHYLSTPLRYRWMGITPTLPAALARVNRPDVVHIFGFRDPVTTGVAAWCRVARIPYVFEPLGMFEPRLRKVLLKRALDATLYRGVARGATAGRIHTLPLTDEPPHDLYPQADVFVLASAGESFGIVAAEAAAAGTPVIVSDRCGIASFFEEGEALIVPYERAAVVDAVSSVLADPELRARLARGGIAAARRTSWDHVTDLQEEIYREVASRTAETKFSTDGS